MRFSVITICWNAANVIEETILSIINQEYEDYELIIIDGKSSDNTLEIVNNTLKRSNFPSSKIHILSERDNGVFDAMNKGVKIAKGDYVIFMNCGDSFYNKSVLYNFSKAIDQGENGDVYYGNTLMSFYEGRGIFHDDETIHRNAIMPFIHQSAMTKHDILLKHPFDLTYRICADFELYHWMREQKYHFIHNDFIVSCYDAKEGLSENNPLLIRLEKDRVQRLDKNKNYWLRKIMYSFTIGLIQPIKNVAPRWVLNIYFRRKKKYIQWL